MSTDFKQKLWKAAEKLRAQMDAAEYKHIVLGLIFLKYISDTFFKQQDKVKSMFSDPSSDYFIKDPAEYAEELEERDYYTQDNVFWVPQEARWKTLRSKAKQSDIGSLVDDAMTAIENENPSLRGKLDKHFGRAQLGQGVLGELIDLISTIGFADIYDASELMGEEVLVEMAREVAKKLRDNLTVDWAVRDSVRAKLRILIRTLLRKYKYPPDQQKDAVDMVLRQAEVISEDAVVA